MIPQNLLIELFVEELPPKALPQLGRAFAAGIETGLRALGLLTAGSALTSYASPRRLAVHLTEVLAKAPDRELAQKLMPASVGLDGDGQPTPALRKKLSALGLGDDAATRIRSVGDGKAQTLFIDTVSPGATLVAGVQEALLDTLAELPIPKLMTYQLADGWTSVRFVRPAHGLVALYGDAVLPVQALGLQAGRETQGHRFEATVDPVSVRHADTYAEQLQAEGGVIPGFDQRRAEIVRQLDAAARAAGAGLRPVDDPALLDEVTALVENPNVLACQFEAEYLEVPQECLILTMKANQKYFPLLDAQGRLNNRFLVVSNIRPADASAVTEGNERVIRPRLSDARFFYDQDRKKSLQERVASLDKVVYHARLGSQGQRMLRVRDIATQLAQRLPQTDGLADAVHTAATLAKCDLLTEMVGEFPELQGVMGRYYALHDGLGQDVAQAIEDHYKPRFAGDALPRAQVGLCLALADKLETLCGLWGIGERPSGDKDPFALRRHALGVVRMLMERPEQAPHWPLAQLLDIGREAFRGVADFNDPGAALQDFVFDRLANLLREQGYGAKEIDAVLVLRPQNLAEITARLDAVRVFTGLPEAPALAAANKRVANILKKSERVDALALRADLLVEPAEQALAAALEEVAPRSAQAHGRGDYTAALQALAALKTPVDAFFDTVLVNADDPALRANRLSLLGRLHAAMQGVADLSHLAV